MNSNKNTTIKLLHIKKNIKYVSSYQLQLQYIYNYCIYFITNTRLEHSKLTNPNLWLC